MKINCGPTYAEHKKAQQKWHSFFPWLWPVRVSSGDCRWLEYVERKGTCSNVHSIHCPLLMVDSWRYEYRSLDKEPS